MRAGSDLARLLSLSLALAACQDRRPPPPAPSDPPAPEPSSAPNPGPTASARRPTRRYYLARTATRCEIYFADPGSVSTPEPTPCPADLQLGERIRIAGRTCAREGSEPARTEPVVCPDPLTNLEKRDLAEKRH